MITETVNAVLQAENEANTITAQAMEEAKRIVSDAQNTAEAIRKNTAARMKSDRKIVVAEAEKQGEEEFIKITEAGKQATDKLEKEISVEKAVEFIKNKVLSSYARR